MEIPKAPIHNFPLPQGTWRFKQDPELGEVAVYRTPAGRLIAIMNADDFRRLRTVVDAPAEEA